MNKFSKTNILKSWPENTNLGCWWCCHTFTNQPIGVPCNKKNDIFYLYGCFCSYNCATSYVFNNNIGNKYEQYSLLKLIYKKIHNKESNFKCAPPKEILEFFGGTVSISDYRKSFDINDLSYRYLIPPIISIISQVIEEKKNILNKNKQNNKVLNTVNTFKLKRTKPLNNSKNSLESTMGLTIK